MTLANDAPHVAGPQRPPRSPARALRPVHRQLPFATTRVVAALILREMSSSYGRTPGGYLWSLLEPVGGIVMMAFVFDMLMNKPQLGTNFLMFYATGFLPFYVFQNVSTKVASSLNYSRQLLAYPRVTVIDALLARYLLNLLSQLLNAYVIIAGTTLFYDTGTTLDLQRIVTGFAMAASLAAGVGLLNCFLMSMFPIWQSVWGIVTRPLLIVSGVLVLTETIPEPFISYILWNPLVHVVAEVRSGFYHGYAPPYVSPLYVFGVSLATGMVGLLFLWRYHRTILEK